MIFAPILSAADTADIGVPFAISSDYREGDRFMGVRLRGRLPDGNTLHGLSGLAWHADAQLLYAVSDLGYLVHLRPHFHAGILVGVSAQAQYPLRNAMGAVLAPHERDAEELSARYARNGVMGDAELVVSLEHGRRIVRFSPQGRYLGELACRRHWLSREPLPIRISSLKP